jgi:hypothetical protein
MHVYNIRLEFQPEIEQRYVVSHLDCNGMKRPAIVAEFAAVYHTDAFDETRVKYWRHEIKLHRSDLTDRPRFLYFIFQRLKIEGRFFCGQNRDIIVDACPPISRTGKDEIKDLEMILIHLIFLPLTFPLPFIQLLQGKGFLPQTGAGHFGIPLRVPLVLYWQSKAY